MLPGLEGAEAATRLAATLKTPLQIGQHLVRTFEAGFEVGAKPVDESWSRRYCRCRSTIWNPG